MAGMFKIFGYDKYYKDFDPAAFKPEKVIIATDADKICVPYYSNIVC